MFIAIDLFVGISLKLLFHTAGIKVSMSEVQALGHVDDLLSPRSRELTSKHRFSLSLFDDIEMVLSEMPCSVLFLDYLDLSKNRIKDINKKTIENLKHLTYLNLNHNNLKNINFLQFLPSIKVAFYF